VHREELGQSIRAWRDRLARLELGRATRLVGVVGLQGMAG